MRSANEISAVVLKAARGAGMPLGCAEELSRAAPNLMAAGALGQVPELLSRLFEPPSLTQSAICGGHPVLAVIAWRDFIAAGQELGLECEVTSELKAAMIELKSPVGPFDVDAALWEQLESYANKMLVPESEASRLGGAGAGLTDND